MSSDGPTRIVSLDYCADQYVLALAERETIAAVSQDAEKPFSYMRGRAAGLPKTRAIAEDVLALKPDLVVRAYGGGADLVTFLERADIPVVQIGWVNAIKGEDAGSVSHELSRIGDLLGREAVANEMVTEYQARLNAISASETDGSDLLYMTPGGATTGPGSLVHDMIEAAGYRNFEDRSGWHELPLERLAGDDPDRVAAAFYETFASNSTFWSSARHPIAKRQLTDRPVIALDGAWTACGGWFLIEAVEAMAAQREGTSSEG